MDKIAQQFFDIFRLKAGPQDLPASKLLMALVVLAYAMLVLMLTVGDQGPGTALQVAIVATLMLTGLVYLMLWVRDYTARYAQTLTAMAGCGVVLELLRWPLVILQQYGANDGGSFFVVVAAILLWGLIVWEVAVIGNIFKHALDTSMWMGLIISCFYVFVSFRVMRTLFFTPETATTVPVT